MAAAFFVKGSVPPLRSTAALRQKGPLAGANRARAPMRTEYWIEQLTFAVEVFDERSGNLIEVLARLHDLDPARAAYKDCRRKYPSKLIMLCQGGRILRRSDRDDAR
jgi:hypothetical protein